LNAGIWKIRRAMKRQFREYLLEFTYVGRYVKVSAIDSETNTEVSIVGAAAATEAELKRVAVRKLEYVLAKNLRVRT
jgi:hypothetical protein